MTSELARRISELRACENIAELHVVTLDEGENRALVLIVPRVCADASTDGGWEQPNRPLMMLVDSAALLNEDTLH